MTGWNLPPGVNESDIPGNRPQDIAAQTFAENQDVDDLLDWIGDHDDDCVGCVLYEDEGVWLLEADAEPELPGWPHDVLTASGGAHAAYSVLTFDTRHDALAYAVTFRYDEILDAMVQEHLDDEPHFDEPDYEGIWDERDC